MNDLNQIIYGTCNILMKWITTQVYHLEANQFHLAKTKEQWYAVHCICGCTYYNCGFIFYNYHVSESNIISYHTLSRFDISNQIDVCNIKSTDESLIPR